MNKAISRKLNDYFAEQAKQGTLEIRADALKQWARKEHFSPTELHKTLKDFVEWKWLIRIEKIVEGHKAIFYALDNNHRQWYLNELKEMEKKLKEVDGLNREEKLRELNDLVGFMMVKFADFVPFYIHHVLRNKDKIRDANEELETLWHWALYPYLFLAAQVCLRNSATTMELPIMQEMDRSFEDYLKSDYHRKMKALWESTS
jgi:hypothetical protein